MSVLSKAQIKGLILLLEAETWCCAYELGVSLATLISLVRIGLAKSKSELGSMFSPRTLIFFHLTKTGKFFAQQHKEIKK